MIYTIIIVSVVITVMILVMTIVLKKTVKIVNEQSKNYFVEKIQGYDEIIEAKEKKLKELKENIESIKKEENGKNVVTKTVEPNDFYYDNKVVNYRNDEIIQSFKKIDKMIVFDSEKIIIDFIKNIYQKDDKHEYNLCKSIKNKLNFDLLYELTTMLEKDQLKKLNEILNEKESKILDKFMENHKEFNINEFTKYIEKNLLENDPIIYVRVGSIAENYDYINKNIKTEYDDSIFRGITIIYKNKLYDYSLN